MNIISNETDLNWLRNQIDQLDADLIAILLRRFEMTRNVGRIKAKLGMSSVDEARLAEVVGRWKSLGLEVDLGAKMIESIITTIHNAVVLEHEVAKFDKNCKA